MGGCCTRRCTVPGGGTQVGQQNNTTLIRSSQEKKGVSQNSLCVEQFFAIQHPKKFGLLAAIFPFINLQKNSSSEDFKQCEPT